MRALGIILIVIGIAMMVFTGINFEKDKKVMEIGSVEIDKSEDKHIGWPIYAGGAVTAAGVVLTIIGFTRKRKTD